MQSYIAPEDQWQERVVVQHCKQVGYFVLVVEQIESGLSKFWYPSVQVWKQDCHVVVQDAIVGHSYEGTGVASRSHMTDLAEAQKEAERLLEMVHEAVRGKSASST